MPSPEAAARNRSRRRRANWFVKSTCTGSRQSQCRTASATGPQFFTSKLDIRFSIFLPPALHTLPIAPHPIATSSSRHPKRSSWKLCNEYGIKKCLPHAT
ncbi:BQ5605_C003g02152 [Microbotryum silenes-dioicae]|uniref:BQ5605_C003g02152 protein n=1 Tax=Microbotryum silenes-dioicae TaxID=796604 RepID=A0A2X0M554_9BASI|nr:BQ5605_C003g02152 [Microbotryum silenes-dioicae]